MADAPDRIFDEVQRPKIRPLGPVHMIKQGNKYVTHLQINVSRVMILSKKHLFDSEGHVFEMVGHLFYRERHLFDRKGRAYFEKCPISL